MNKRLTYYRRRRKKRKVWGFLCLSFIAAGMWGIFTLIKMDVMASPEDPAIEALAKEMMEAEPAVSSNIPSLEDTIKDPDVPVIVVDPGHGGVDGGCSEDGTLEKDINLSIANLLKSKLTEMGYQVIMARNDDHYLDKEERVKMANENQADIYISIHQNSFETSEVSGIETWYHDDMTRDSKRLAQLVHRETIKSTGAVERELRDDGDLCVTGKTTMPACLIETGFLSNTQERELLNTLEYQQQIADGIASGIELYFHPKTMYLTFDDGPSAENTNVILDILKARDIKATFFVIGEHVRNNPEIARRIVNEGHAIGIHCNWHDYKEIYKSPENYIKDFEEAYAQVVEITGVETKLFRFPGGSINSYNDEVREDIIKEMTERGFIYYDWNASLEDSVKKSVPEDLIKNAKESTLGRKKIILLAHDSIYNTTLCIDEIIEQFPEYKMEVLTPSVEPIQF